MVRLHDYYPRKVVEKTGNQYTVDIPSLSNSQRFQQVSATRLMPLRKDWKIGELVHGKRIKFFILEFT